MLLNRILGEKKTILYALCILLILGGGALSGPQKVC